MGWVLILVETMRAEWHVTLPQALFKESLRAALELWPALLARHGADTGPGYVDAARQRAKARARKFIEENFTVIPSPTPSASPAPTPAP